MRQDIPEIVFPKREDFRSWLSKNAEKSEGVWLIFGKTKEVNTLTANDALEEALCFGWIDGQIKSIDDLQYRKYFARRQAKSNWSSKNKKIIEMLRQKKMMNELGEKAIEAAMKNGSWNIKKEEPVTIEQVKMLKKKLAGMSAAHENFCKMPPSVQLSYTRRYLSFKSEESRERDFLRIVDRLNKNLKPM